MVLFNKLRKRLRFNIKGNILITVLVTMPVLMGATGLVLDWGRGVWVATQLKRAADSGALAGASNIAYPDLAEHMAIDFVNSNFDSPDNSTYYELGDRYTVDLSETVPTLFMRIFGRMSM